MKQYVYTPQEIGLTQFSDGILRLDLPETRNPIEADVFVCPEPLFKFTSPDDLRRRFLFLSAYNGSVPHVFFDLSEHFTTYDSYNNSIFIRAALTQPMLALAPNSIAWPWPSKDYSACINGEFSFDVTFHGWLSTLARKVSVRSCSSSELLTCDIQTYPNFFGHQSPAEQVRREALYASSMARSRMCLGAESIPGVLPYRFYEAMSAGRAQVYVGHNYVLPFADVIPYSQFVNFVNVDNADEADAAVLEWKVRNTDDDLRVRGGIAREYWELWLDPNKWVQSLTTAVHRKLQSMREVKT